MTTLLATTNPDGTWSPGIGDPTVWGWIITAAYLAAGLLCLRTWRTEEWAWLRGTPGLKPRFWLLLGIGLLFLCINKQLDLQSLVTVIGRRMAKQQGWYAQHRGVQLAFVIAVGVAAISAGFATLWWVRRVWRRYLIALIGAAYLGAFVVIRAASFHHVDTLLFKSALGPAANRLLELGGIVTIAFAAWQTRGRTRSATTRNPA